MKKLLALLLTLVMLLSISSFVSAEETDTRPRTIVTTDLECDDINSLLHLLLYANDIDIAGIIYSASTNHWQGDGEHQLSEIVENVQQNQTLKTWRPMDLGLIESILLNDYGAVYGNLVQHDNRYPTPGELLERTKIGNILFEGDMREPSEGSELIKSCILDDDPRTLYLEAWGGVNTIARALKSIEEEYRNTNEWNTIYEKVCNKVRIISFGDQDNVSADYVVPNWPDLVHLYCVQGYGYGIMDNIAPSMRELFAAEWMTNNIKFNHGPLMGRYLLYGDGTYYVGENPGAQYGNMNAVRNTVFYPFVRFKFQRYDFISEGDSPCYMYLLPFGLRGLENSAYGSIGGRIDENGQPIPEFDPEQCEFTDAYSLSRWLPVYHNDWAARADWCVTDYENANHQPVVTAECIDFTVEPGAVVELVGSAYDPDGDALSFDWYLYKDACVYSGANLAYLDVWQHDVAATSFTVPKDAANGDYFNLVFSVTDDGTPALTRYAQAIVKIVVPTAQ